MKAKSERILDLLTQQYGPHPWQPRYNPISELIYTILSQNTSDHNSHCAFAQLRSRFPTWEEVAEAPVSQVAAAIQSGGLARVKAPRIQQALRQVREQRGVLELDFLRHLPLDEAKGWLRRLPGVGPKTVACVLLFSLGRPVLPVDTHVLRVTQRLGLLPAKVSVEGAQVRLESQVPPKSFYHFHLSLVEHGRKVCTARKPRCSGCILSQICPSALTF